MWSLFPQTSSSNLNNSLYLPLATPRILLHKLRDRSKRVLDGSGNPAGRRLLRVPRDAPWHPEHPEAQRRARGEGRRHWEGGWVRRGGPGLWFPHPRRSRARPAPVPGLQTRLLPSSAPSPGPAAPRVTSGQIQRDVLFAAVIPPCAKQTHSPN